ncbi:MotE family protein [Lentilitoribacter sp. EG35]|jgi:flagellar motility protein MotE (MotC chaperone)|uniref:MotE family protein n=1 Tax=Lentilitoribacter sp. EG35 TaxID=3234192 RepID=UPI00346022BE
MKRFKVDMLKHVISPKSIALALVVANLSQINGTQAQSVQIDGNDNININEDIRKFCDNIADAAKDKRYLLQREELHKLQTQVDKRIDALKVQRDDYKQWLKKRNDFLEKAEAGLVEIFKKMKPDAAAKQLEIIDQNIAAALIMKLSPRLSSQIFNEMDAEVAATLATIIASTVDQNKNETQS